MSVEVRQYQTADYNQVAALYAQSDLFGGQYDDNRDSEERLRKRVEADPDAVMVAEDAGHIVGTVSLIEDGRIAWLFRFAVEQGAKETAITERLCLHAIETLRSKGHKQVLVYTPVGNERLDSRYERLGFIKGSDYTCFWKDI